MTKPNESQEAKSYDQAVLKDLPKSEVEITVSIASDKWEKFRVQALKNLNESLTVDGFRKGQVPENILAAKIGQGAIDEETAELAISRAYVDILIDNKIDPIGKPKITVTKLARGNPLEFKAVTAVMPKIILPDCGLAAGQALKKFPKAEIKVEEKEIEETILKIRKSRAGLPDDSGKKAAADKMKPEEKEKKILDSLPEFNDDFVRGLGEFRDIADFKAKIREMIGESKKDEAKEKSRIAIADALLETTTIDLPEIMVQAELDRTQAQFVSDLERMGAKLDDYLKQAKKTLEEIRKDWRPQAEKKAKLQLILNAIAAKENIHPSKEEIDHEVSHIIEHYKDADRDRAAVYAETVLTNEKVFEWLEKGE